MSSPSLIFTKNSFFVFIFRCSFIYGREGHLEKFTKEMQDRLVRQVIEPLACDGLRTISIAYRDFVPGKAQINEVHIESEPNWDDEDNIVNNLTCLAVVGIEDPVRPEVRIFFTITDQKNFLAILIFNKFYFFV